MTATEYKDHLCDVIAAVFKAEVSVNKKMPQLKSKLKSGEIEPRQYIEIVAVEIISKIPDDTLQKILHDEVDEDKKA